MIYIDNQIGDFDLNAALAAVSPQRCAHALQYRHEHDQRLSLAAYRLFQRALRIEYGIQEPPIFDFSAQGKPTIVGHDDIHFSLSHCHEAVACVVADSPVGIDVESLSNFDAEIVKTVMSDEEHLHIVHSPDPRLSFIRLWTMKESLLKMTGEGLSADMRHVLTELTVENREAVHFQTTVYQEFVCTVCFSAMHIRCTTPHSH